MSPFIIPIIALLIAPFAIYFHYKEERERRKERMLAIEKGVELPPEPITQLATPLDYLRKGLIFLGSGLGLSIGGWIFARSMGVPGILFFTMCGFVLTFIGAGLVVYYKIQYKAKK
jgi:hypothetical protein